MQVAKVSFEETNLFDQLFLDYINEKKELRQFYNQPNKISAYAQLFDAIEEKGTDRTTLVTALNKQYQNIHSKHELVSANINSLVNNNTFTVCTGHQLCLFTGPLYFIYKIITTINLAEQLNKNYPDKKIVPVYWMATEDHDFEEISAVKVFGKTIKWEKQNAQPDANKNYLTGALSTASLEPIINELKLILGDGAAADKIISELQSAYLNSKTLAEATRNFVNNLFGKYGVVVLDANDADLKKQLLPFAIDDIKKQSAYQHVTASINQLTAIGYKPQVNPREINFFITLNGERERIKFENYSFDSQLLNKKITKEELLALAEKSPEMMSPNVVIRPLYQQLILPNVAYVGGPAEIAYWLEFKSFFDSQAIGFPILVPRNFAMLIDEKSSKQWNKLGFLNPDYFKDIDTLSKALVLKNSNVDVQLINEITELEMVFDKINAKAEAVDQSLKAAVAAEKQKLINAIKNIESKFIKAEKAKSDTGINQINKIKEKLFPEGTLQERYDNFISYYLKDENFIQNLKDNFEPFQKQFMLLVQ
jgi:bacillithiol synthase